MNDVRTFLILIIKIYQYSILPDSVFSVALFWQPLIWWHSSLLHRGKQFPPHCKPKKPEGQGSSQESPKYPFLHAEIPWNINLIYVTKSNMILSHTSYKAMRIAVNIYKKNCSKRKRAIYNMEYKTYPFYALRASFPLLLYWQFTNSSYDFYIV